MWLGIRHGASAVRIDYVQIDVLEFLLYGIVYYDSRKNDQRQETKLKNGALVSVAVMLFGTGFESAMAAESGGASTASESEQFTTFAALNDAFFAETSGEALTIELGCADDKSAPCGNRFNWNTRGCWGYITAEKYAPDGSLTLKENMQRYSNCERGGSAGCWIVLDPGWATYTRFCGSPREVLARGRFDKGRNVELFAKYVDKSKFYKDPLADEVAQEIPPRPWRLEDENDKYVALFKGIPEKIMEQAKAGQTPYLSDAELRDTVDAVISIDSKGWGVNTYIPGSARDLKVSRNADDVVVQVKLTYFDGLFSKVWKEETAAIAFSDDAPKCITYWNNSRCSENYIALVNPDMSRELTGRAKECISPATATYREEIAGACVQFDSNGFSCVAYGPTTIKETPYMEIINSCPQAFDVVVACPLLRQGITLTPNSRTPVPGLAAFNCKIERSLLGQ